MNTKYKNAAFSTDLASFLDRALIIIFIVCVTLAVSARSAASRDNLASVGSNHQQHAQKWPTPYTCNQKAANMVHVFSSLPQRTAEQSFRLAVLDGNESRLKSLYNAFSAESSESSDQPEGSKDLTNILQMSLDDAALTDNQKVIRQLIRYGAKPNFLTDSARVPAITVAAECGNIAAMNALYSLGANPSLYTLHASRNTASSALEVAIQMRQNSAILWLLDHGVDVCNKKIADRLLHFIQYSAQKAELSQEVLHRLQCSDGRH